MNNLELVYGVVEQIRTKPLRIKARLPSLDDMLSPWALLLTPRSKGSKHLDAPIKGEQVAMLIFDEGESALCLGSVFSSKDDAPTGDPDLFVRTFPDGTRISYDHQAKQLNVNAAGSITLEAAAEVMIKATQVTLDSDVSISKTLTIAGKPYLLHKHIGNQGSPTSAVIP